MRSVQGQLYIVQETNHLSVFLRDDTSSWHRLENKTLLSRRQLDFSAAKDLHQPHRYLRLVTWESYLPVYLQPFHIKGQETVICSLCFTYVYDVVAVKVIQSLEKYLIIQWVVSSFFAVLQRYRCHWYPTLWGGSADSGWKQMQIQLASVSIPYKISYVLKADLSVGACSIYKWLLGITSLLFT